MPDAATVIRVALVQEDPEARARLVNLLGEARHARFAVDAVPALDALPAPDLAGTPNLVLVDPRRAHRRGWKPLHMARARFPLVPILLLLDREDAATRNRARRAGAVGIVSGERLDQTLLETAVRWAIIRHARASAGASAAVVDPPWPGAACPRGFECPLADEVVVRREDGHALREFTGRLEQALGALKQAHVCLVESERLRAARDVAAHVMHDFNNNLMPIQGYTELLLEQPQIVGYSAEALNLLKEIHSASLRAAQGIRRLQTHYQSPSLAAGGAINLDALLAGLVQRETAVREGQVAGGRLAPLRVELRLGSPPPIPGNADELEQVFVHLVRNACEAMPRGGTLTLCTRVVAPNVEVEVADTGLGMSDEALQQCFEPFYTTKGSCAAGVGLSIVRSLVNAHGGRVQLQSEVGAGTTVTVTLPILSAEWIIASNPPAPTHSEGPDSMNILLIDDDPIILELLGRHLRRGRHTVTTAPSGREGLAALAGGTFDVVITDRVMPGMSGDEVAAEIRRRESKVPIVMLTALGDFMRDHGVHPDGVDAVLHKPVPLADLDRVMQTLAQNRARGPGSASAERL